MKSTASRSAKPPKGKLPSSSSISETDWAKFDALKDEEIFITPEHPEADVHHVVRGIVRRGLQQVPPKTSVSLRLDTEVLDWFKAQGTGYQTRINAVLRAFKEAATIVGMNVGDDDDKNV
jgi:uncharacterized protein (DUF4415 family)